MFKGSFGIQHTHTLIINLVIMMTVTIYFISLSAPIQISVRTHSQTLARVWNESNGIVPVCWTHLIHLIWTLTCQISIKVRTETWHDECLCVSNEQFIWEQTVYLVREIAESQVVFDDVKCVWCGSFVHAPYLWMLSVSGYNVRFVTLS